MPAYILARDDDLGGSWLAMYYMPEDGVPQWHRVRVSPDPLIVYQLI